MNPTSIRAIKEPARERQASKGREAALRNLQGMKSTLRLIPFYRAIKSQA